MGKMAALTAVNITSLRCLLKRINLIIKVFERKEEIEEEGGRIAKAKYSFGMKKRKGCGRRKKKGKNGESVQNLMRDIFFFCNKKKKKKIPPCSYWQDFRKKIKSNANL